MEISVTDFSVPIGASVFKFCVHLKEGKVYCVNGNYFAYRNSVNIAFLRLFRYVPTDRTMTLRI